METGIVYRSFSFSLTVEFHVIILISACYQDSLFSHSMFIRFDV